MAGVARPQESATCGLCGRRVAEAGGGEEWLRLEVTRGDLAENREYVDADFCTQAHAAEWLSRPLPPPAPVVRVRAGRRERVLGVAFAFSVLWGRGLMVLGAYALVRLLGGWG